MFEILQSWAGWLIDWIAQSVFDLLNAVLGMLPSLPSIDWTAGGWVKASHLSLLNAWVPVGTVITCLGVYVGWWAAWSAVRMVAKLVWSG